MAISWSKKYIKTNPEFELTNPGSRPKLQAGEMTIVYDCLERFGPRMLYHLKLLSEGTVNRIKNAQAPVIREVLY